MKRRKQVILLIFLILIGFKDINAQGFKSKLYNKYNCSELPIKFLLPGNVGIKTKDIDYFKDIINKHWTIDRNYSFITKESLDTSKNCIIAGLNSYQYISGLGTLYGDTAYKFQVYYKGIPDNGKEKTALLFSISLNEKLSEVDIAYSLGIVQFHLVENLNFSKTISKYSGLLKTKTLLIPNNQLGELTEQIIKDIYPYSFKIVNPEEINRSIIERREDVIIIYIAKNIWADGKSSPRKYIYYPANGAILSYSIENVTIAYINYGFQLKRKDFKNFLKKVN